MALPSFKLISIFYAKDPQKYHRARGNPPLIQEEEERLRKLQRQEKAAHKFSKQRFMKLPQDSS